MLDQLIHNGVIVPDKEPWRGLTIVARGRAITLSPHQEEMALAFARKKGTPYVDDPVFVANFMRDWSADLGIQPDLRLRGGRLDGGGRGGGRRAGCQRGADCGRAPGIGRSAPRGARTAQGALWLRHRQRPAGRAGHLYGRAQRHLYGAGAAPAARALERGRGHRRHHPQLRPAAGRSRRAPGPRSFGSPSRCGWPAGRTS